MSPIKEIFSTISIEWKTFASSSPRRLRVSRVVADCFTNALQALDKSSSAVEHFSHSSSTSKGEKNPEGILITRKVFGVMNYAAMFSVEN
jgi:hypothetical protein